MLYIETLSQILFPRPELDDENLDDAPEVQLLNPAKRIQNAGTKSLQKSVYISLCGFRLRLALPTPRLVSVHTSPY